MESLGIPSLSGYPLGMAERVGSIDLVQGGGCFIHCLHLVDLGPVRLCSPIPAQGSIEVDADLIMRNVVLKNQVVVGTVNADGQAFVLLSRIWVFSWKSGQKPEISHQSALHHRPKQGCFWTSNQHQECRSLCVGLVLFAFRTRFAAQSITRNFF